MSAPVRKGAIRSSASLAGHRRTLRDCRHRRAKRWFKTPAEASGAYDRLLTAIAAPRSGLATVLDSNSTRRNSSRTGVSARQLSFGLSFPSRPPQEQLQLVMQTATIGFHHGIKELHPNRFSHSDAMRQNAKDFGRAVNHANRLRDAHFKRAKSFFQSIPTVVFPYEPVISKGTIRIELRFLNSGVIALSTTALKPDVVSER
jgi:hypothetical protein